MATTYVLTGHARRVDPELSNADDVPDFEIPLAQADSREALERFWEALDEVEIESDDGPVTGRRYEEDCFYECRAWQVRVANG